MCRRRRHPNDDVDIIQDVSSLQIFVQIYKDRKPFVLCLYYNDHPCMFVCECVCMFEALQKNLFNVRNKVNKEMTVLVTSL
jgi:hypothetical protein